MERATKGSGLEVKVEAVIGLRHWCKMLAWITSERIVLLLYITFYLMYRDLRYLGGTFFVNNNGPYGNQRVSAHATDACMLQAGVRLHESGE